MTRDARKSPAPTYKMCARSAALALALALTLIAMGSARAVQADGLAAGPMPGHTAMRAVQIWLQGSAPSTVVLEYWPADAPESTRRTPPTALSASQHYTATIPIGTLRPGTTYHYRVLIDGVAVEIRKPLAFHTQPLWQWRRDPPAFRAIVGSCAFINDPAYDRPGRAYGAGFSIFDTIADRQPHMMLWLGDNVYFREADYDSRWGMAARYRQARGFDRLQRLLRSTHHYALWDDHDYGPNNSNASFVRKADALALFRRYWANPGYGLPELPGAFTRLTFRDVDFFLLDDRYYRDSDRSPEPDKQLFGAAQLRWLKNALLRSRAPFKIIAAGSQLLNDRNRFEGWNHFAAERAAFLDWLQQARIRGVIFLSGDRHHTELLRLERARAYPLYELTCSPLTAASHRVERESNNPALVQGTLVGQRNFCQLDFSGPKSDRRLTITVNGTHGESLWQRELRARELR